MATQAYAPWVQCTQASCASGLRARSWYFVTGAWSCLAGDISNEARSFYAAEGGCRILSARYAEI